jgi:hypothetical protein
MKLLTGELWALTRENWLGKNARKASARNFFPWHSVALQVRGHGAGLGRIASRRGGVESRPAKLLIYWRLFA